MKGFKVRYDAKKAAKLLKKRFKKFQKQDGWKNDAADVAIKNIKGNTRLQKSTPNDGSLKKIKASTSKDKKRWAKKNAKGTSFSPAKSNLTRSGQLLESLKRTKNSRRIIIQPTGKRAPYAGQKKAPTNKQLTKYLKEMGFSYLGFNEKIKKIVRNKIISKLRRAILRK